MANLSGDFGSFEIAGPIRWAAGWNAEQKAICYGAAAQIYLTV